MLRLQVTLGYHASFISFTLLISIARMRKYIISPPILLVPCTSPSPDNLGFRTVSWEMETLNPWGWGGPRAHCPTSWVRALILRLLQERRALAPLSPPPAAAFKRRKQLWLHSWRVWSCEREVAVFPAYLQDGDPQGGSGATLPRRARWHWGCPSQTGGWGTSRVSWRKEDLGDCDFCGCWYSPHAFSVRCRQQALTPFRKGSLHKASWWRGGHHQRGFSPT